MLNENKDVSLEGKLLQVNEALLLSSLRQHELTEATELLNLQLQREIAERKITEATLREREAEVRASDAQYRSLFNSIEEGFCVIEKIETRPGEPVDFRYLEANPAFEKQSGVRDVVGRTMREVFPGELQEWINTYQAVLEDGEAVRFEREFVTTGRVLELYVFRLEDNPHTRLSVIFQDVTVRKHAEAVAQRLAAIVTSSEDAIFSTDIDGVITSWNRGAEVLLGYSSNEIIGEYLSVLLPPHRLKEQAKILEHIRDGNHVSQSETSFLNKDGREMWVSLSASSLRNAAGDIIGVSQIARDITSRRLADEHRNILVSELNHRAKNSLAMVQAITAQTLRGALSLKDVQLAIESRLGALARGHDLLTSSNWAGTDLESVTKAALEPHRGGENRFHIEGPFVSLTPATALTFTMALHELCTNAIKYGALSLSAGTVSIVWQIKELQNQSILHLQWTEKGGPTVMVPTHKGFGSRLVEKALAMELSGEVRIHYESSGVVCTIEAPLPRLDKVNAYGN